MKDSGLQINHRARQNAEEGLTEFYKRVERAGPIVTVHGNSPEEVTTAIHIFKRRIEKLGILDEYKSRQCYLKPSVKKKLKKQKYAK